MTPRRFPDSPVFYRDLDRLFPTVVRGEGVWLVDAEGRRYLDAAGGALVVNVGHGRAEVARAMAEQASAVAYAHGSRFTSEPLEELAAMLVRRLPAGLDKIYLVHGGAEATETAIKLAIQYQAARGETARHRIVGLEPSYHGNTLGALAASGKPSFRRHYRSVLADWPHLPAAYCYRCALDLRYPDCALACAESLDGLLAREGESVAAVVVEPVGGASSGAIVPPAGYVRRIAEICRRYGVLFVADEVLTGLGRTGRFFAVEHDGVAPDVLLMGKGLSGGYVPAGAVATRTDIVETVRGAFGNFVHGFTYSHHPVVAAACRAVVGILEREDLVARAEAMGAVLHERLRRLEARRLVGDLRGRGLLAGIELVADRPTRRPFPRERRLAEEITERAFAKGLVVYPMTGGADGTAGDFVLLAPPFVVERAEIDRIVELLDEVLVEAEAAA